MASPRNRSAGLAPASRLKTLLPDVAFVLLVISLLARTPLKELLTINPADLFGKDPMWWASSPAITWILHIVAALGVALAGLWAAISGRKWRFTGLLPAAGLMVAAALIGVGAASDKRLAINAAAGTILPLITAAALYQLLITSSDRRRALLAGLVAISVANCYRGTAQYLWEYRQTWEYYEQNKERYWRSRGISPDAPEVKIYESRLRARQPSGYFYHPNAMASFLLLGLAAAVAACRRATSADESTGSDPPGPEEKRPPSRAADRSEAPNRSIRRTKRARPSGSVGGRSIEFRQIVRRIALPCLLAIVLWHVLNLVWVRSVGSWLGLACGVLAVVALWVFRRRPGKTGLLCAAMVAGLQAVVIGLALSPAGSARWLGEVPKGRSLEVRLHYWRGAARLFADHPAAGVGPGQFGKHYLRIKPAAAAEEVTHPHNWVLAVAAEWGALGLAGMLLAWIWTGWRLFRRPVKQPEGAAASDGRAVWLAMVVVLGGCVVLLSTVAPVGLPVVLYEAIPAMPLALLAGALAAFRARETTVAKVVLIGGLIAFFVHGTVGIGPNILGAVLPFWAMLALAMAWGAEPGSEERAARGGPAAAILRPAVLVVGSAGVLLATAWLAYRPIGAAWHINRARVAFAHKQFRQAAHALLAAADADPLDPVPFKALGLFHQIRARRLSRQAGKYRQAVVNHLRGAIGAYGEACRLDRLDAGTWRDLAMASRSLAQQTRDPLEAKRAVWAMGRSVRLYPNRPRGRVELAEILMESAALLGQPDLLRRAIDELEMALRLDEDWPRDDPRKFSVRQRANIRVRIDRIRQRLKDL